MKRKNRNYLMRYRHISVDRFEIVKFFSYTSTIMCGDDVIIVIDGWREEEFPNVKAAFDLFYEELREKASKLYKEATGEDAYFRFNDNKTVFQIRDTFTGNTYFIGRYDWRRAVGRHCYMYDGHITDFKTFKMSDYLSNVYADARGTYLKFEVEQTKIQNLNNNKYV